MTFVPIRDAVIVTQAKPGTIRQWARRLQLTAACDVHTRSVVYSLPELVQIERATRERKQARYLTSAA